jgi:hypothetical protein
MKKSKLIVLISFLAILLIVAGCGPSEEDYACVIEHLDRAKYSDPIPDDDVIKNLDKGIEAAEAGDLSTLKQAFEDARHSLMWTLAVGDTEHVSPEAALHLNNAMKCIDYCPAALEETGNCP